MKTNHPARIATMVLCVVSAATLCGCRFIHDCSTYVECLEDPAPTCVGDPATGLAEDGCGVFVSSALGDDGAPGTRAQPVRTIQRAIALAQAFPRRVYACAEVFAEAVDVPAGVEIWGGLDCANDWAYLGGGSKTIVAPAPDAVPLRFFPGEGRSMVADLRAQAANAAQLSGSSIAVLAMQDAVVEILRSDLVAGDGAAGLRGEDGGAPPAASGAPGLAGGLACQLATNPGAPSVITTCDDGLSIGGQGGEGTASQGGAGLDGEPMPNPPGSGKGGQGEANGSISPCTSGQAGADGAGGEIGLGARGQGDIAPLGWQGQNGRDGGNGRRGQGGGGGGGARGGGLCPQTASPGGAAGGSGGAGGCGGKGGKGGGYGGASIGLVSLNAQVTVRATTILTGKGGDGGAGGFFQLGGAGGLGGPGGAPWAWANPGCEGGPGGKGGDGAYGGGGLGGPSMGIATKLDSMPLLEGVDFQIGAPGKGGDGALPSTVGADGVQGDLLAFPLPEPHPLPGGGPGGT